MFESLGWPNGCGDELGMINFNIFAVRPKYELFWRRYDLEVNLLVAADHSIPNMGCCLYPWVHDRATVLLVTDGKLLIIMKSVTYCILIYFLALAPTFITIMNVAHVKKDFTGYPKTNSLLHMLFWALRGIPRSLFSPNSNWMWFKYRNLDFKRLRDFEYSQPKVNSNVGVGL